MNLANCIYKSLADAIIRNSDLAAPPSPSAAVAPFGDCTTSRQGGLILQSCNIFRSENLKPLRERGAGAAIGEIDKGGNHDFDEFNVPGMHENDSHSHPTPIGLIPQSPSDYRGFYTANLEAQGGVA